jgi:hypothetical protein
VFVTNVPIIKQVPPENIYGRVYSLDRTAKYYDRYGIYTLKAAQAFHLTNVKPLNYK